MRRSTRCGRRTSPAAVSLYVPTEPASSGDGERIAFKNLVRTALDQLAEADKHDLAALEEAFADLEEDDEFWRHQARTLAVFATPGWVRTFRLPNRLVELAVAGERLHVKPLMRAVTFPQTAFVLALAQGGVRLLETVPDAAPEVVRVPDMPSDVASAVGKSSIKERAPVRKLQGTEGQKVRMRQYAPADRPRAAGGAARPRRAAGDRRDRSRSMRSSDRCAGTPTSCRKRSRATPRTPPTLDLVTAARDVLDRYYAGRLAELKDLFAQRSSQNRTSLDVATVARLATQGAVDTLFLDIDAIVPGTVAADGAVTFAEDLASGTIGVVDEIARRAWLSGARLVAVRREDVPGGGDLAAILRYAA